MLLAAIPVNVCAAPVIMLLPFYTTNALKQPLASFGYLLAAMSVGMLIGYALAGRFPPPPHSRHTVIFICVLVCAAAVLSLAFVAVFWQAVLALTILGCLIGVVTLVSLAKFIHATEEEKRGRVTAVLLMVTQGLTPLAMSLIGVVSDLLGNNIRLLYAASGVILFGAAFAMSRNRDLRNFLRSE